MRLLLRRWMLLVMLAPVLAWALDRVRDELQRRRGRSRATATLEQASSALRRLRRRRR